MTTFRSIFLPAIFSIVSLTAGVVLAQHDVGGGSTKDVATPAGESTGRRGSGVRRTSARATAGAPRRPRVPVKRGTTAEQYNQQGDEFFDAKQYDDAFDAYTKAVQLKPLASAYRHLGWIYNDREEYEPAVTALQQS